MANSDYYEELSVSKSAPAGDISLRRLKAGDQDLAEIASLLNAADWEASVKNFSEADFNKFLALDHTFYLLAYAGQEIAGAIHGYDHLHPTGVKYLYVDEVDTIEGHRRQGVATVMMNEVFAIAHENGDSEIWLGTEDDNEKAKAFYLSLKPDEIENGPI
jgi:ribosomal protein S18 acetylase RimI-like enzyme